MRIASYLLLANCIWTVDAKIPEKKPSTDNKEKLPSLPNTTLSNGEILPLVGFGVGNLENKYIVSHVAESVPLGFRLIDTAHASRNEHLIRQGVQEANMHAEPQRIRVHMLLHWPRCLTDISWMNCAGEEKQLPDSVKNAGPPPHLDKENAYKESWKALEDIYLGHVSFDENLPKLASIGVSNFDQRDLRELAAIARVTPHILQHNVWYLEYDPNLMKYCREHKIHFQAYNTLNGIIGRKDESPYAYEALVEIAKTLSINSDESFDPGQVVIKWIVDQNVSVIPRTSNRQRLVGNSPRSIAAMPEFSKETRKKLTTVIQALLSGRDLVPPQATFVNRHKDVLHLFWSDTNHGGTEVPVKMDLAPGESWNTETFAGHRFVAYDGQKKQKREFTIRASFGEKEKLVIDEL